MICRTPSVSARLRAISMLAYHDEIGLARTSYLGNCISRFSLANLDRNIGNAERLPELPQPPSRTDARIYQE
jgi:hypothetical protein